LAAGVPAASTGVHPGSSPPHVAAAEAAGTGHSTSSTQSCTDTACTDLVALIQDAQSVCEAASACAALCSSRVQLLGCANLSCTTPPAAGLGGCEASLVVNCRGSVCGGCGVVRYCSAACAQQDWPGHRRVCRRLAPAAAAARACNASTGGER
jgi:hypothetical protein